MENRKIIVFTCNWNAYSGLEKAGKEHQSYSPDVRSIRVGCLGRLHPGIILKAFEKGAAGVMILGCPPDECHYQFGSRQAGDVFLRSKELIRLLGFQEAQLCLDAIAVGDGKTFAEKVRQFVSGLNGNESTT